MARICLRLDAALRDDEEWITVNGTHIPIGEGGKPTGGPKRLQKAMREEAESQTKSSGPQRNLLQNVAKSCNIKARDGVHIRGYSSHILDQMKSRGFDEASVEDAIRNPLHVSPDRIDEFGQPSRQYIGRKVTIAVNPETGVMCTGWPTSKQRRRRYGGD